MPRTRHVGVAMLGIQSVAMTASTAFCGSFNPADPTTLIQAGVMAFTAVITGIDYKRNSGKN